MYKIAITSLVVGVLLSSADACSRVTYNSGKNDNDRIVVGRSMDWIENTRSSIWAFLAGMQRSGHGGENSLTWSSKYGSVITTMYDLASIDGMNTEGLVANTLYLAGGSYGVRDTSLPALSIGLWQQYFLDRYATVAEAVNDLRTASGAERFQVRTKSIVPGVASLGHLSLTDASGDNVVMEYYDGKLTVHHGNSYRVMTNEPVCLGSF